MAAPARAGERDGTSAQASSSGLQLLVHYDFFLGVGTRVNDASGKKHEGTLVGGEIVEGRRRNAVRLDGKGHIRVDDAQGTLCPVGRPFSVGAVCNPTASDGVVAAMGDRTNGFSLSIEKGVAWFAVRSGGKLTKVAEAEPLPLNQWSHLLGGVDENGEVWLIVNGLSSTHRRGKFLARAPAGPLCIGADPGAPVSDHAAPAGFRGMLQEVRFYWGFFDLRANREEMKDWVDLSGCGCK